MTFPALTKFRFAMMLAAAAGALAAIAHGNPYVNKGELKITQTGTHRERPVNADVTQARLELFYGLTDDLGIGIEGEQQRVGGDTFGYRQTSLTVRYQLNEPEDWWWVAALQLRLSREDGPSRPIKGRGSLLLQNDSHGMRHRVFLNVGRDAGANRSADADLSARIWSRYKLTRWFEPGVEWVGEFGEAREVGPVSDSRQYLGPVFSGTIPVLTRMTGHGWEYELGCLYGLTDRSDDSSLRWKLEMKVQF